MQAYLITDNSTFGFSNVPTDNPQSVYKKQLALKVGPHIPIYQLDDGTITAEPPFRRGFVCLGELGVSFQCGCFGSYFRDDHLLSTFYISKQ